MSVERVMVIVAEMDEGAFGKRVLEDVFTTVVENGEKKYYINGTNVTKDEGNKKFLTIKNKSEKFYTKVLKKNEMEEAIEILDDKIDKYTDYIEDYKQKREADIKNRMLRDVISMLKDVKWGE